MPREPPVTRATFSENRTRSARRRLDRELAKAELLHLAARGHRKLGDDEDALGPELPRDALGGEELGQLRERRRIAPLDDDARAADLAEPRVGRGDDRDVPHLGVTDEHVFDFLDGYVLATADDEVLGTPADANEAVRVHPCAVSGREPSLAVELLVGEAATLHVADERARAARDELAFFAGR